MKGKIVELEYNASEKEGTFKAKCNFIDYLRLQNLWGMYKQNKIDIEFGAIEYKCNCANDTIDNLSYSYKFLDDNVKEKISLPKNVKMDWGKWADIMRKRYGNKPKTEVIFNEPATILYKGGKKYVCKCDKQDKFSEELGLALCLLKSFGVSYSDFEKLLKGAKRQNRQKGK